MTTADISLNPSSDQDVDVPVNWDNHPRVVRVFHGIYNTEDKYTTYEVQVDGIRIKINV
jgi:hypothetical protein